MGLFSSKKKTVVSLSAYNLAGAPEDRIDFMKQSVFNANLSGKPVSSILTDEIVNGQSIRYRRGLAYANTRYSGGPAVLSIKGARAIDLQLIADALAPRFPAYNFLVQNAVVTTPQFDYWAEDYLEKNYGYDNQTSQLMSPPADVAVNARVNTEFRNGRVEIELINPGQTTPAWTYSFVPDDWNLQSEYIHSVYRLQRETIDQDSTESRPTQAGDSAGTETSTSEVTAADEMYTTTTNVTTTVANGTTTIRTYKTTRVLSRGKYFMYRVGAGTYPALDAAAVEVAQHVQALPAVPLRVDNKDIHRKELRTTEQHKTSKMLLSRMGIDLMDTVDSLNDNENLKDIDFAYMVFGVELGGRSAAEQEYVFRFLDYLRVNQVTQQAEYDAWVAANPGVNVKNAPPMNTLVYRNQSAGDTYNAKFQWNNIRKETEAGDIGKVGTYTTECGAPVIKNVARTRIGQLVADAITDLTAVVARRQVSPGVIEKITVVGLSMHSTIYKGKTVEVKAYDAFNDPDEDGQGFILPLLMDIYLEMSAINQARLGRVSAHMALYCYQIVKIKWYQRGAFKIVMIVIAIAIAYVSAGTASGVSAGIIAGVTGLAMGTVLVTLLAAIVNTLIMMILMNILSKVATQVFGEKWGAVIATIIAIAVTRNFSNIGNSAIQATKLTAANIINNIGAVVKVYSAYTEGAIAEMRDELESAREEYEKEFDLHKQALLDLNSGVIFDLDVMMQNNFQLFNESPESFLSRTLITGSDVVEITLGTIENFVDSSLALPA